MRLSGYFGSPGYGVLLPLRTSVQQHKTIDRARARASMVSETAALVHAAPGGECKVAISRRSGRRLTRSVSKRFSGLLLVDINLVRNLSLLSSF